MILEKSEGRKQGYIREGREVVSGILHVGVCLLRLGGTKGNHAVGCSQKLAKDLQFMIKSLECCG